VSVGRPFQISNSPVALERGYRIVELPIDLSARPEGSSSKIRVLHDGFLILSSILTLCRDYKPLTFCWLNRCFSLTAEFHSDCSTGPGFYKQELVVPSPASIHCLGTHFVGATYDRRRFDPPRDSPTISGT
jgi:hypothetical protein